MLCDFLTGGLGPQSMFFDKKVLSSSLGLWLPRGHWVMTSLSTSCSSRGRSGCWGWSREGERERVGGERERGVGVVGGEGSVR